VHVLATAGHVDHGKSTLVRALTGMEPDRYAEERRRGLTLDLGFAWTSMDDEVLAFVDVPGHERFVTTMLAGVGSVPAVVFVVAADGGWMPQSQEHLDALDALGVRHGLLVVTRCDLAAPEPVLAVARERLAGSSLAGVSHVAVSATTGEGMAGLRTALRRLVRSLPAPDVEAPVRLWVDRSFSITGAGTVVTGTLAAGTLRRGDRLHLPGHGEVTVRGLQTLGGDVASVAATARVAVNLRGVGREQVRRGDALLTPGRHLETTLVDVRVRGTAAVDLPGECLLHLGSAGVSVRVRPLGGDLARLRLASALPLRIGDGGLLRDPGRHLVLGGLSVLDVDPPALRRRGAARQRADLLAEVTGEPDAAGELERRGVVRREHLLALGMPPEQVSALAAAVVGDREWLLSPARAAAARRALSGELATWARQNPLEEGMPVEAARQRLGLPSVRLVAALVQPPLTVRDGRVVLAEPGERPVDQLPRQVRAGVEAVLADLARAPYAAPEAHRLRDLGLGPRELAAAVRTGALARVGESVYLTPAAVAAAAEPLRTLPQPFTLADARKAWGTSRRVAVPLLQLLDQRGTTRRLPDDSRHLLQP
jgi:selenocysteine-specific elongation factor